MGDFLYIFGMEKELTDDERIQWFISNYYETGMEYKSLLFSMKETNLDGFQWYDEVVSIPKYRQDVLFPESLKKANEVLEKTKDSLPTSVRENILYSEIEHLIIGWSIDGTKTAGHLTRQIMELISWNKTL